MTTMTGYRPNNSEKLIKCDSFENDQDWLIARKQYIGASEVSALFDCNPYKTKFQLWHEKKSGNVEPFSNERTMWGNLLEGAIARGIAQENNLMLETTPFRKFYYNNIGMSATPDFIMTFPDGEKGCLEVKNVDTSVYLSTWDPDTLEAPLHIELQLQQQMELTGYSRGAFGVLVGGNRSVFIERERHEETIKQIRQKVEDFWTSIDQNIEPDPFDFKDYEFVKKLYPTATKGKTVDFTGNKQVTSLIEVINDAQKEESEAGKLKDLARAKLLRLIEDAEFAYTEDYTISARELTRKGYTVSSTKYRQLNIKKRKDGDDG